MFEANLLGAFFYVHLLVYEFKFVFIFLLYPFHVTLIMLNVVCIGDNAWLLIL